MKSILLTILLVIWSSSIIGQEIIKMQYKNGIYTIPCLVNGLKLEFIFDTGASDVSLSLSEAIFMLKNGYLSKADIIGSESYIIADGSILEGTLVILRSIKIGNKEIRNVRATIVHSNTSPLLLGQSALKKIGKFSFDYTNNYLIIENYDSPQSEQDIKNLFENEYITKLKVGGKLRSGSSSYSSVITYIPTGATVTIIENIGNFWKVIYNSEIGFIGEEHLHLTDFMKRIKNTE